MSTKHTSDRLKKKQEELYQRLQREGFLDDTNRGNLFHYYRDEDDTTQEDLAQRVYCGACPWEGCAGDMITETIMENGVEVDCLGVICPVCLTWGCMYRTDQIV